MARPAATAIPAPLDRRSAHGRADVSSFVYYPIFTDVPGRLRGKLAAMKNAAGHVTRYEDYDVFGNVTWTVDANGVVTTMTYDALGRPLTTTILGVAGCDTSRDPLCSTDIVVANRSYDASGPLLTEESPDGVTATRTRDAAACTPSRAARPATTSASALSTRTTR